eukprot:541667-Rhodomonas_salina.2
MGGLASSEVVFEPYVAVNHSPHQLALYSLTLSPLQSSPQRLQVQWLPALQLTTCSCYYLATLPPPTTFPGQLHPNP